MDANEIDQIEFLKFKKELIASINAMQIDDMAILAISHGEAHICTNCNQEHKGTRVLSKCTNNDMISVGKKLLEGAVLSSLGIDDNKWGKPKEN